MRYYAGLADPDERKVRKDKGPGRKSRPKPPPRYIARHGLRHLIRGRHGPGKPSLRYVFDAELAALGLVPK